MTGVSCGASADRGVHDVASGCLHLAQVILVDDGSTTEG